MPQIPSVAPPPGGQAVKEKALRNAAEKLEAGFLAEMLKAAGLGKTSSQFGGGAGEDHFASFLVQEQAMQMVKAGGIGLSEAIFDALKEKTDEQTDK